MESRIESILTNMINDETETIHPQSRIEVLLSQLAEKIGNIDQSLTRYRGRVDSVADLPAAGEKVGDWYFVGLVTDTTMSEYAWNGTSWDPIGSSEITVSGLVSYAESQSLRDSEKLTARNNIGLGNVDNTADADKPISTATQTAINGKADAATTYTKTEVDTALSGKQDALSAEQLSAVNSGITSTDVAQITTNKNNISYIANNNVINILNRQAGTDTSNGITFTTNIDGSITLSGTATNAAGVFVFSSSLDTTDDTYILYGDGFIEGVYMDTYETGWANQRTFTSWVETVPNTKIWRLIVSNGTNADNVTIRPMMCRKSLFDGSYHQPAMSNAELTEEVETNKNNILSLTTLIPKVVSGTYSLNDLTWTTSVDGIIYSNATVVDGITTIYSAIITGFGRLRATDVIVPILSNDGTQIRFMANTNSWVTDAYVTLRIVGI